MKQTPSLFLCLLLCIAYGVQAQTDSLYTQQWNRDPVLSLQHTSSNQRQVITAKQILASGYTRLSDVLQLIDAWHFTTRAGDRWALKSNGTGSYSNQNWILMLNGQRVEMERDETMDINRLGIPVSEIERIEVVNTTGMYLGEFVQNGLIQIVTKKSPEGLSSRTFYGQQYQTIARQPQNGTANPELGYSVYQTIGYTRKKFHIQGTVGTMEHPVSDSISPYTPSVLQSGLSTHLEAQYTGNKLTHQWQTEGNWSSVISNNTYFRSGYVGLLNTNSRHQFRLSGSVTRLGNTAGYNASNSSIVTSTLQHRFLKPTKKGNFIWQNGLGVDYLHNRLAQQQFTTNSNGNPQETAAWILKPYSSINIPVTRKTNLFSDLQMAFANRKVAPKISVGLYKRVSFISNYSFVLSYNEQLLEEYFLNTVNQQIGVLNGASYFHNPKQTTADFYYTINFGNSVKFSFHSGLKNTFDLPDYRSDVDPLTFRNNVSSYIKRATYQFNWINQVNVHYDIIKNLVVDINYLHTRTLDTWDSNVFPAPKHKFTLTLQYDLPKRFSLWTRNYWQSETQWSSNSFGSLYDGSNRYLPLAAIYTWDVGVSKKLYKETLAMNMSARNLFNSTERYSPVGAQFDIRFAASITANIDGIFASRAAKP